MAQFTSLGRLSQNWLAKFAEIMLPHTVVAQIDRISKTAVQRSQLLLERLHLVWPSVGFVRNSKAGYPGGGSICASRSSVVKAHERMYQYLPQVASLEATKPHIKTFAAFDSRPGFAPSLELGERDRRRVPLDWFLMSSCNLSKPAWGEVQCDGAQLKMRIFEVGVLILADDCPNGLFAAECACVRHDGSIDVPLVVNLRNLVPFPALDELDDNGTDDCQPWSWDVPHTLPDHRGVVFDPQRWGPSKGPRRKKRRRLKQMSPSSGTSSED